MFPLKPFLFCFFSCFPKPLTWSWSFFLFFFLYSVIAHLSVLAVPVWKAAVAMEMAEWPFAVG